MKFRLSVSRSYDLPTTEVEGEYISTSHSSYSPADVSGSLARQAKVWESNGEDLPVESIQPVASSSVTVRTMADVQVMDDKAIHDLSQRVDYLTSIMEWYIKKKTGRLPKKDDDEDDFTTDFSCDENEDRGNWSGRLDFLLACLGYAVGLGNVWRFPYLCYKNGGAVFFIPYCIMLFFVGVPIFFLELSLGQYTSSGPLTCWEMAPLFKGVGVAMLIVSGLIAIYYNMIIAWAIFYLCASFRSVLPWASCDREWASEWCEDYVITDLPEANCTAPLFNNITEGVCYNGSAPYGIYNTTLAGEYGKKVVLATEDYLNRYMLGRHLSNGLDDLGEIRWQLVLCYLLAWIIAMLSLIKGIKSSGKVVYFTALFPYVVLIILFVRGLTLPGHEEGIRFYLLEADLTKLTDAEVWKDAAVQIFFSLSASFGGLIALSSYNRFHNDCLRDSLIVSFGNCLTSFFAGFVIFSFLGFLAHELNTDIKDVAEDGVGLAFTVYPHAVTLLPISPLWSILFFLMLITLGLDSEFALLETVTTSFMDQFPRSRKYKWAVIMITSLIFFLLGLTMATNGGVYMLQLMDTYSGGWNVLVIAFCECICVMYFYGFTRYSKDLECMLGKTACGCCSWTALKWWWALNWHVMTPVGIMFILIFSWIGYTPVTYGDYVYPTWGEALGWLMTITVVVAIFLTPIITFIFTEGSFRERWSYMTNYTRYWGPALPKHRRLVHHLADFEINPWEDVQDNGISMGDIKVGYDGDQDGVDNQGYDYENASSWQ